MKKLALCCLLAAGFSQNFAAAANQATKDESVNYSLNNYAQTGVTLGAQSGYSFWGSHDIVKFTYKAGGVSSSQIEKDNDKKYMFGVSIGYDFALTDYFNLGVESGFQYANIRYSKNYDVIYPAIQPAGQPNSVQASDDLDKVNLYSVPIMVTGKFFVPDMNGLHFILKAGVIWEHYITKESIENSQVTITNKYIENKLNSVFGGGVGFKFHDIAASLLCLNYQGQQNHPIITLGLTYTLPF